MVKFFKPAHNPLTSGRKVGKSPSVQRPEAIRPLRFKRRARCRVDHSPLLEIAACIRDSVPYMNPNLAGWLGVTPLHRFAQQGDVEKAVIFLDHGANLHACDEEFCTTPLGYAARAGKLRMVKFLLRRGAAVTLPHDLAWAAPMALAAYRGHDEIVRVLNAYVQYGGSQ